MREGKEARRARRLGVGSEFKALQLARKGRGLASSKAADLGPALGACRADQSSRERNAVTLDFLRGVFDALPRADREIAYFTFNIQPRALDLPAALAEIINRDLIWTARYEAAAEVAALGGWTDSVSIRRHSDATLVEIALAVRARTPEGSTSSEQAVPVHTRAHALDAAAGALGCLRALSEARPASTTLPEVIASQVGIPTSRHAPLLGLLGQVLSLPSAIMRGAGGATAVDAALNTLASAFGSLLMTSHGTPTPSDADAALSSISVDDQESLSDMKATHGRVVVGATSALKRSRTAIRAGMTKPEQATVDQHLRTALDFAEAAHLIGLIPALREVDQILIHLSAGSDQFDVERVKSELTRWRNVAAEDLIGMVAAL